MAVKWVHFSEAFDGRRIMQNVAVRIEQGRIAEISETEFGHDKITGCLTSGFVDLQVNGGGGILLNNSPTAEAMVQIAEAHKALGTAHILPTVITDRADVLEAAADAALAAKGEVGLLGLHIEGPHIALEKRGTHSADHIRPFDVLTLSIVTKLRDAGLVVMITIAPEVVEDADIAALAETGAIVSLGHTAASAGRIERAVAAGARCGTHLFNAMSQMTSREPGAVGGILSTGLPFGLIADGHHVDDRMIALAMRAGANPAAAFLVSDAMATVGGPDRFDLYGRAIRLEDGRLVNAEGNLAGAHFNQLAGVQRLVRHLGVSREDALRMAITRPADLIERPAVSCLVGRDLTDAIVLNDRLKRDLDAEAHLRNA